jgi:hypothetical protein
VLATVGEMQLPARPEILQGSRAKQSPYCFKRLIDPTPPKNECTEIRKTHYKRNAHGAATQTLRRPRHKPVQGSEVALTNRQTHVLPTAGVLKFPTRPEIQVGASTRKSYAALLKKSILPPGEAYASTVERGTM